MFWEDEFSFYESRLHDSRARRWRLWQDYLPLLDPARREEFLDYSRRLRGLRVQHINSTASGGGVAELLAGVVPLQRAAGLEASWSVLEAGEEFFRATKAFHNALHGARVSIAPELVAAYEAGARRNMDLVDEEADVVVIHDPQPLPLVLRRGKKSLWLWYCHIDVTEADPELWAYLRQYINKFDGAIFHLPAYFRPDLAIPQHYMPPGIDPLSEKNQLLPPEEVARLVASLGLEPGAPYVLQVSRFDRLKDPVGVIAAYRLARSRVPFPFRLVLAGGGAADDPEGEEVLREVREAAGCDPGILILPLPPESNLEINALQRGAAVVIQKSLREGFGLTVTEAMWKGRPVVGSAVGGIRHQILHKITGLLVEDVAGAAEAVATLLTDTASARRLGEAARERVRRNFLLPVYLLNWLKLLWNVKTSTRVQA